MILLAAAIGLPAMALAALLVFEAYRNERTMVEHHLSESARALSLVVDHQIGQAEAVLEVLATSPRLSNGDISGFYGQAHRAMQQGEFWVSLTDLDGRQIINTYLPYDTPLPVADLPPSFHDTLALGRTYVSNLYTSYINRGNVIAVTVPVGIDDQMRYYLSLVMLPNALNRLLADQPLGDGVAAIVDREGTVIARSRRPEQYVGGKATADLRALIPTRNQGVVESVSLDGIKTLAAYSKSPVTGWTVVVGAAQDQLFASAKRMLLLVLAMSCLLIGVGFAMYVWAARGVVRAVRTLEEGALLLGRGAVPGQTATGMEETDHVAQTLRESAQLLVAREQELKTLNETLEARVQARTEAHAEANRALSIRNRELQDFAYVASHDLQEPLRKITAFSGLLQSEFGPRLDDTGRYYVERMQAAAERMSRLIKDLLAFSRVTTQTHPPTLISLNSVVEAVESDLEMRLAETGGRVEAGELESVRADPVQMHQLLLNLISNALKFHRPGVAPIVRLRTEAVNDRVRIVVEDNGIGFESQYAERIFAPFQRLHGKDAYEGTGMGLAIVRRIVERHGGTVTATGSPGSGSCFEVTLPADASVSHEQEQILMP